MAIQLKQRSVLPGFGLTMGFTLFYLSLLVLIPLAGLFFKSATISWAQFYAAVTDARVVASYKLTFGASLVGGHDQRRVRADRGVGAGALSVSRPATWSTRWSICRSPCRRPSPASR